MHDFSPPGSEKSLPLFILSYLVVGVLTFDPHTKLPIAPKSHIMQTFNKFVIAILIASLLSSILNLYDFELYDTGVPINSLNHSISDMISLPHLVNNFFLSGMYSKPMLYFKLMGKQIWSTPIYRSNFLPCRILRMWQLSLSYILLRLVMYWRWSLISFVTWTLNVTWITQFLHQLHLLTFGVKSGIYLFTMFWR